MRRRFQFSLRALLVALTVACVWLGWKVERARSRGRAIDAIVAGGGTIDYGENSEISLHRYLSHEDHFWHDLRRIPVRLFLDETAHLGAALNSRIRAASPITTAYIHYPVDDDDLLKLNGFNDGCRVVFLDITNVSAAALDNFIKTSPHVRVIYFGRPQTRKRGTRKRG